MSNSDSNNSIEGIELISSDDIKKMNFYDACLYLERLNELDELTSEEGNNNE